MATWQVYLVRHGIAAARGEAYPDDSKRPLTSQGIARLRKQARGLNALGVGFDVIITSPLTRAKQTADILAHALQTKPAVISTDALAPAGTPAAVIQEIVKNQRRGRIALVGHEPNMGELAARLIGARTPLLFKKGGICRIDFEMLPPRGAGQLQWFMPPKVLRSLA